jgi:tetratricopeptide (TPR) repeat protein
MKYFSKFLILFLFIVPVRYLFSQDVDIVPYLKQIESGEKSEAEDKLVELKKDYPNSPSVMFLEGVLTPNGQEAVAVYSKIADYYPDSKYADAALYRIYAYYYALGLYETAKDHLNRLKKNYPQSPYIKIAERNIPSENEFSGEQPKVDEKEQVNYKFTIQAGAFSKLDNAESLKKDFEDSGFFSEIKNKVVGGTNFHVVYVGEFVNEDEAKNFLQVINSEFKLDGRVVNIE